MDQEFIRLARLYTEQRGESQAFLWGYLRQFSSFPEDQKEEIRWLRCITKQGGTRRQHLKQIQGQKEGA